MIQKNICALILMATYECNFIMYTYCHLYIFIIEIVCILLDLTKRNLYIGSS